ncbi:MAG: hypothetical protein J3Q66DRAFT_154461 [Benniella sp.]|nr:MAG: hypothetical protein J3Q66DRAFT_154461 [Benniella sp.]
MALEVWCLVNGKSSSEAFSVDADASTTIDRLKKLIKERKPKAFENVDADELKLWCASISWDPPNTIKLAVPPEKDTLNMPKAQLKTVYPQGQGYNDCIIVQPPPSVAAAGKQKLSVAFPNGLPYKEPSPLLRTPGAKWIYQPDPGLYPLLRDTIKSHFNAFFQGHRDKTMIPLYLFLCGAGTGKSRNAQEFQQSLVSCLSLADDNELKGRIKTAWAFHVSLENGTSPSESESDPIHAIGTRMLSQLLPHKGLDEVMRDYVEPHPLEVLRLVTKHTRRSLKDATVILVVDGLQAYMDNLNDGQRKESAFYRALTNIGDLALRDAFLLACCTATVTSPVDQVLAFTHRKRVTLPVASLKPPYTDSDGSFKPVFDENDHVTKVLVSDCGGHGRALECLQEVLDGAGRDYNVDSVMNQLHAGIRDLYSEAILIPSSTAEAMGRAILTRTWLDPGTILPGANKKPGELAVPGLVRYEQPNGLGTGGYLTAPYIWVWYLSYQPNEHADPLLKNWGFSDYSEIKSKVDPRSPPGAQFWQNFEYFVAAFRCLKSKVLREGERTKISVIHAGARLRGNIEFENRHLALERSCQRVDTKSTEHSKMLSPRIRCSNADVDVRQGTHCIINAPSASSGDSFLGLSVPHGEDFLGLSVPHGEDFLGLKAPSSFCTEVHQCKLVNSDNDRIDFQAEREKAACCDDFFILFTTQSRLDVELPPLSGIVDKSNWEQYFGPFAGRAFVYATVGPLDINQANRSDLKRMAGVGEAKADKIIEERGKRPFDSYEDAIHRLRGVGKTVLKRFKISQRA